MTTAEHMDYLACFPAEEELAVEILDTNLKRCLAVTYDIAFSGDAQHPGLVIAVEAQKYLLGS